MVQAEDDVPSPPLNLTAEAGDGHVNLTWDHPADMDPSDISEYWVYLYAYPSLFNPIIIPPDANTTSWTGTSIQANSTSHTMSGLDNGVRYYFHVRVRIGDIEGEPSDLVSATPKRLPSEPRHLTGDLREGEVFLEWEPPDITGDALIYSYIIMRGPIPKNMEEVARLSIVFVDWGLYRSAPTNYTDDDLGGKEAFFYQVIAANSAGTGPPSTMLFVGDVDLVPVVPSIPGNTRAWVQNGHINITWSPPGFDGGWHIFKYRIYRWTDGGEVEAIGDIPSTYLYFLDVYVTPGIEYHYYVTAWNAVGESSQSLDATAMVQPSTIEEPEIPVPDSSESTASNVWLTISVLVMIILIPLAIWILYPRMKQRRNRNKIN